MNQLLQMPSLQCWVVLKSKWLPLWLMELTSTQRRAKWISPIWILRMQDLNQPTCLRKGLIDPGMECSIYPCSNRAAGKQVPRVTTKDNGCVRTPKRLQVQLKGHSQCRQLKDSKKSHDHTERIELSTEYRQLADDGILKSHACTAGSCPCCVITDTTRSGTVQASTRQCSFQ